MMDFTSCSTVDVKMDVKMDVKKGVEVIGTVPTTQSYILEI